MITEDYVSFETAKLLKEKGFDELCIQKYDNEGYLSYNYVGYINTEKPCDDFYALAPTLQMAMKYLREVHKLYIAINIEVGDIQMLPSYDFEETVLGYNFAIYNEERLIWVFKDKTPRSYEQACEAACIYALKNLI